jgi:hypothetical protein
VFFRVVSQNFGCTVVGKKKEMINFTKTKMFKFCLFRFYQRQLGAKQTQKNKT